MTIDCPCLRIFCGVTVCHKQVDIHSFVILSCVTTTDCGYHAVQVRTKDRTFESIAHLIEYHMSEQLPITSSDSEILLQTPVVCHHRN